MTDELRDKIASLRAIAPKLNASTAEAGKVVQEVEAFLESLGVGIPAEVHVSDKVVRNEDGDKFEHSKWLTYDRLAGKYRIHVVEQFFADAGGDGDYKTPVGDDGGTAWGSLPRNLKLESFAKLPELLDTIVSKATALAELADKTVAEVRSVIGEVGPVEKIEKPVKRRVTLARAKALFDNWTFRFDPGVFPEEDVEYYRYMLERLIKCEDMLSEGVHKQVGLLEGASYGKAVRKILGLKEPSEVRVEL